MIDLLISILVTLGLNFTQTDKGQISLSRASFDKLQNSEVYKENSGALNDGIIIVPDVDPEASK